MAGQTRNVTVNVVGNASGFSKTMSQASGAAETTGSKISGAFKSSFSAVMLASGGALGPLQGVIDGLGNSLEALGGKSKSVGDKITTLGVAGVGAGALLTAAGSKDAAAQQQLQQAIENTGGSYDTYKDKIEGTVKSMTKYGYTSEETMNGLQQLTSATKSPSQALSLMGTAANLAAAKHESLGTAVSQLTQIIAGKGTKTLQSLGIQHVAVANTAGKLSSALAANSKANDAVSKAQQKLTDLETIDHGKKTLSVADQVKLHDAQINLTKAQDKAAGTQKAVTAAQDANKHSGDNVKTMLGEVAKATNGQAGAAANTYMGKMKSLRAEIENNVGTLGKKYGPAVTMVSGGVSVLGGVIGGVTGMMKKSKEAAAALTKEEQLQKIADGLAAIAAGGEAAAEGVEATATEAEGAADMAILPEEGLTLGPIILIVAAIAALGVGIYELVTHWKAVWGAIKAVVHDAWSFITGIIGDVVGFIKKHWELLVAILTGPFGLAVLFIKDHWDQIVAIAKGIPAKIEHVLLGIWKAVTDPLAKVYTDVSTWVGNFLKFVGGIPASIVLKIKGLWNGVTAPLGQLYDDVTGPKGLGAILNFITGMPGMIETDAAHMFHGIWDAFKGMLDGVVGLWNTVANHSEFTLPSFNTHIPGVGRIGGGSIGPILPDLPYLASGGIAVGPTLAMIGEGGQHEAVVPLDRAGEMGFGGMGGTTTVNVPVYLDSKLIGTATAPHVRTQLLRNQRNFASNGFR